MKVYLDDARCPMYCDFEDWRDWIIVRTLPSFITLMSTGAVLSVSLDHDLGMEGGGDGYDAICWIERAVRGGLIQCPDIRIHTGNPAGFKKMNLAREAILRFVTGGKKQKCDHPSHNNPGLITPCPQCEKEESTQ